MDENLRIEALGRELEGKEGRIRQINLSGAPLLQKTLFFHPELQEEVYDSLEAVRTNIREFNKRFLGRTPIQTTDAYLLESIGYQLSSLSNITFHLICLEIEKESVESPGRMELMQDMIEFGSKVSEEVRDAVFLSMLRNSAVPARVESEAQKTLQDLRALGPIADEFCRYFEKENDLVREREDDEKDSIYTRNKQMNKKLAKLSLLIRAIEEVERIQRGDQNGC